METYESMKQSLESLIEGVDSVISNLANCSALIKQSLDGINWAGFYLMDGGKLKLGPFQGKVACTAIEVGKGVCGSAVQWDMTMVVPNVHDFPGHIACDGASNSEIVVPIHKDGKVWGVLDIDSPVLDRFTEEDARGLEALVRLLETAVL